MCLAPGPGSFGRVMTFEVTIRGAEDALGLKEPVARVLCPVEEHVGPCEVP